MADPARFDIKINPVQQSPAPGDPWGVKNVEPAPATQDWSVKSVQPEQQAVPKSDPWYVKAISPITNYWPTQQKNAAESFGEMKKGVEELGTSGERLTGTLHTGLGAAGYVSSPINSAIESIAGKPIED